MLKWLQSTCLLTKINRSRNASSGTCAPPKFLSTILNPKKAVTCISISPEHPRATEHTCICPCDAHRIQYTVRDCATTETCASAYLPNVDEGRERARVGKLAPHTYLRTRARAVRWNGPAFSLSIYLDCFRPLAIRCFRAVASYPRAQ